MEFIFITNDPGQAQSMVRAGVDLIMLDLEINGKEDRQGHLDTVISRHTFDDISNVRTSLNDCGAGSLMVRINPLGIDTRHEVEEILDRGADRIMLPMFTHPDEVTCCLGLIAGRAPLTLLLETAAALARLPQILEIKDVDDIHIGLNDLHLDMGLDFMFELFGSGLLDHAAYLMHDAGIPFGIGGVGCIGSGLVPAEEILAAHLHLGSKRVILSRSFASTLDQGGSAQDEICKLRTFLAQKDLDLIALRKDLDFHARKVANSRRSLLLSVG
jgi:hypothetical protein